MNNQINWKPGTAVHKRNKKNFKNAFCWNLTGRNYDNCENMYYHSVRRDNLKNTAKKC